MNLRQIKAFVAVFEEGSFSQAAARVHATQSGLSMLVKALEQQLAVMLFDRTSRGVLPTPIGRRFYSRCLEILAAIETAEHEMHALADIVSGALRVGLVPSYTATVLAPVLSRYTGNYPSVDLRVVEAYSGVLTEQVAAGDLDFAIVPPVAPRPGLRQQPFRTEREFLVASRTSKLVPLAPMRLADLSTIKLVVPAPDNSRRALLENYFVTAGVEITSMLEIDSMVGTLGFVAGSDWMAILPEIICGNETTGTRLSVAPLIDPPLQSNFVLATSARRPLNRPGRLMLDELRSELTRIDCIFKSKLNHAPDAVTDSV